MATKGAWRAVLMVIVSILLTSPALAQEMTIGHYTPVDSTRVSRFEFDYTYYADLTNAGPAMAKVSATLISNSPFITVLEGSLNFGDVSANTTVTSKDTFKVRHDRRGPFDTSALAWTILAEPTQTLISRPRAIPTSGEAPLAVRFIPEFNTDTAIELFEWDFNGDGIYDRNEVIGRDQNFTYSTPGVYIAALRITDSNGKQAVGTVTIIAGNAPPEITAEASPSNGQIPLTVTFKATATDSDGITLYEWDFDGDGVYDYNSPNSGTTTFTYTQSGRFQAGVRVTDRLGASATRALPTTEVRPASPGTPSVTATANPVLGTVPFTVNFTATATDPGGQTFTSWAWDFQGDGTFDQTGPTPAGRYAYTTAGTYFARVRVTAADGDSAEDVVHIDVQPRVNLGVSANTIDPGLSESATITTLLGGNTRVSLVIENRNGLVVKTLVPWGMRAAGSYSDAWTGTSDAGLIVQEGDYYAVLLYELDGNVKRLDLRGSTGGVAYNPPRTGLPRRFQPFAGNPLSITFTLDRASEVTAFMGRFNVNTRLVTFFERKPLGRGSHTLVWNGENGDGQLIHPPTGDAFLFGIFGFTLADNAIYLRSGARVAGLSAAPSIFDPSAHVDDRGTPERSKITFNLNKPADVELMISDAETGGVLDRIVYKGLSRGDNTIEWDGKTATGVLIAPGPYRLGVTAIDPSGFRSITVYALQRVYY